MTAANSSIALLLARTLAGSWRVDAPPLLLPPDELEAVAAPLLRLSAGALGWWRIRSSDLSAHPAAEELHQAYRAYALSAAVRENEIAGLATLLSSAGIEPLFLKGWGVARLYPQPGLRPLGSDIDLLVRPSQLPRVREILEGPEGSRYFVDTWHEEFDALDDTGWDALHTRSQSVNLNGVALRLPAPEDHLAFLCLHALRHGGWQPLWFCDIATMLESRSPDFDWDTFLGADPWRADWLACALGVAHQLLGARVDGTPVARRAAHLPGWLIPTVLAQWGSPRGPGHTTPQPIAWSVRRPADIWPALRARWPDPIAASARTRAPLNELPRLPFQLWWYLTISTRALPRVVSMAISRPAPPHDTPDF